MRVSKRFAAEAAAVGILCVGGYFGLAKISEVDRKFDKSATSSAPAPGDAASTPAPPASPPQDQLIAACRGAVSLLMQQDISYTRAYLAYADRVHVIFRRYGISRAFRCSFSGSNITLSAPSDVKVGTDAFGWRDLPQDTFHYRVTPAGIRIVDLQEGTPVGEVLVTERHAGHRSHTRRKSPSKDRVRSNASIAS